MIYTLRIPTVQFGYIETQFEGTAEEAFEEHNRLINLHNGGFGLSRDEFNDCLDEYLSENTGSTEMYLKMSKEQQTIIQEIKKALKRLNK
jgi:hypothetical protein